MNYEECKGKLMQQIGAADLRGSMLTFVFLVALRG